MNKLKQMYIKKSLKVSSIQNFTFLKGSGSSPLVKGQQLFLADINATENKGKRHSTLISNDWF